MSSRRDFLRNAGLASAATLLTPTANAQRRGGEESQQKLPPSIAALKSRASEARPIGKQERQQRIERARQLMAQNQLDAIFMIGGTSLVYFTGIRWWNSERLFAFVLPQKGQPFLVSPAFEEDRARRADRAWSVR